MNKGVRKALIAFNIDPHAITDSGDIGYTLGGKRPSTTKLREALKEFGVGSELLDDAMQELLSIEQHCFSVEGWPKDTVDLMRANYTMGEKELKRALGVKTLLKGTITCKSTSTLIYAGRTFPAIGLYCVWPSGVKDYLVSLVGTEFEGDYNTTTLSYPDIESIDVEPWGLNE